MNWEAIGAIGEVGGAIGVVATLGYLAAQIRQNSANIQHNSQALLGATELENARLAAEWNIQVAHDPEIIELFLLSNRGELSEAQRLRFRFVMASLFYRFEGLFLQKERGLLSEDAYSAWDRVILLLLAADEVMAWWNSGFHPFSSLFRAHVDRLVAERLARAS